MKNKDEGKESEVKNRFAASKSSHNANVYTLTEIRQIREDKEYRRSLSEIVAQASKVDW